MFCDVYQWALHSNFALCRQVLLQVAVLHEACSNALRHSVSQSFSLLSRLCFWRSLTLETLRWPALRRFTFNWTACRLSRIQQLDLSFRQVAMIISLRYFTVCTGKTAAHILQACRLGLPVRSWWTWSGPPGWRPSPDRQDSRSTTPAVIVDLGFGCPVYATVHCRRPSVSRRRGTNMEQFASWNDVIKFPANIQNQTKISFILRVVSIVFEIVIVYVQCLKCYGIFHFNVMSCNHLPNMQGDWQKTGRQINWATVNHF